MSEHASAGFATRAVHVGQTPGATTGAVVTPVYRSSTFAQDHVDRLRGGYEYGRGGNPTRTAFQQALASLEGGERAFAFPAGLAAEDTLVRALTRPGDDIAYAQDLYGGTFRLFSQIYPEEGRTTAAVDASDPEAVAAELARRRSRFLWIETPSNPLLEILDIRALADAAHSAGALLIADNTFASPYLQQPLAWGADAVVHSTTKYIGGHSDIIGGAVVLRAGLSLPAGRAGYSGTGRLGDELAYLQSAVGSVPGPDDVWLQSRGLKTLAVRMERHSANARAVAQFLRGRAGVAQVLYPGFADHPGHAVAERQMRAFGGIVSLRLGSAERARKLCESTRVFTLAVSLGATESLIEYPPIMTHAEKTSTAVALPDDIVRLSIGLEDPEDLIADLDQALAAL